MMIVGFFEDWDTYDVQVYFSQSGDCGVTECEWADSFDPESEDNRISTDILPTTSFSGSRTHLGTGVDMETDYDFADFYKDQWERLELITNTNDGYFMLQKD